MMKPKISVIVPVYKAEKYLYRCVDSILNQTFTDFEVLLIDDGSPDRSGEICDEYVKKDNRVRVFHKENGGVSSARNLGIDEAKGEWVYFADADDYLPNDSFNTLIKLSNEDVDCIMAGYTVAYETGEIKFPELNDIFKHISIPDALVEMYRPTDFPYQGYLWCKLFRHKIIINNEIRFDEAIYFNEDRLFIVQFLCHLNNMVAYTTKSVYCYIERESGAMGSLKKGYNEKFITDLDSFVLMKNIIAKTKKSRKLLNLANEGIAQSYIRNHDMMLNFKAYKSVSHIYMRNALINSGCTLTYMKISIKQFLRSILLLVYPSLLVK